MWAVPRDSPLPHGIDLENCQINYFMNTFLCYCINTCSKLLPYKYMGIK